MTEREYGNKRDSRVQTLFIAFRAWKISDGDIDHYCQIQRY